MYKGDNRFRTDLLFVETNEILFKEELNSHKTILCNIYIVIRLHLKNILHLKHFQDIVTRHPLFFFDISRKFTGQMKTHY